MTVFIQKTFIITYKTIKSKQFVFKSGPKGSQRTESRTHGERGREGEKGRGGRGVCCHRRPELRPATVFGTVVSSAVPCSVHSCALPFVAKACAANGVLNLASGCALLGVLRSCTVEFVTRRVRVLCCLQALTSASGLQCRRSLDLSILWLGAC